MSFPIKIILSLCPRRFSSPSFIDHYTKKKKKKSTIVKSVERISFEAAIPSPDLSRRYSRESSALFDVCGRSGGIARNREITTLRKKRQAFRARRNCFYSPASSPGKPRQKIDLRYDDPKKPESGFYVCVVISGSARSPRQSLAGQKLKENSVSRKFLSPFLFLRQVNFVINK